MAKDRYSVWPEPGSLLGRKLTAANVTSSHTNLTPARNTNLTLILDKSTFAYVTPILHHTSCTDLRKISGLFFSPFELDFEINWRPTFDSVFLGKSNWEKNSIVHPELLGHFLGQLHLIFMCANYCFSSTLAFLCELSNNRPRSPPHFKTRIA